jgi:hypothetical protein
VDPFLPIVLYVIIGSLAFNSVVFIYLVFLKKEFPRVEYFLIYTMNLFIFLALLISSLKEYVGTNQK